MIAGSTRTGTVEEGLANAGHKLFINEIGNAVDLITHLHGILPNDAQFKAAFETATVSNHRLARYYLRSLEMAAKGEAEPWHIPNDDRSVINLEHVLPEIVLSRSNYRRIGNLALLRASENANLKSIDLVQKRLSTRHRRMC
jgi:Protein of unknown function (DUF1524)